MKDATLFLVDCTQSMFVQNDDDEPNLFQKCMKVKKDKNMRLFIELLKYHLYFIIGYSKYVSVEDLRQW